jgi:hypothetical protein
MDKSIVKRLEALEKKVPSDLIICAVTEDGELTKGRVKDIITKDGELKEGFSGIGDSGKLVVSGSNLKDLERILKHNRVETNRMCTQ